MKKLIVGNWKMHLNLAEASLLANRLHKPIGDSSNTEVVLCPPAFALTTLRSELGQVCQHDNCFTLGIQNIYDVDEGAFTGEISAAQVSDIVSYAIVGHSERRIHFGERDKKVAHKVAACLRHDITPILCVGEKLDDREDGHSKRVVSDQLSVDLSYVTPAEIERVVIAYEPVWAIGSGEFAKPNDVKAMIAHIRHSIERDFSEIAGQRIRVLYGGSVNSDNCAAYLELKGCDGLLVGGASIKHKEFSAIIEKAK